MVLRLQNDSIVIESKDPRHRGSVAAEIPMERTSVFFAENATVS